MENHPRRFRDPQDDEALVAWFEGVAAKYPGDPVEVFSYGSDPDQIVELWPARVATDTGAARGAVVSIHGGGGGFMAEFDRSIQRPVCRSLQDHEYDVYNVEYRRTEAREAPHATLADAHSAVRAIHERDGRPLAVLGHSAGGYLAEWVADEAGVDLVLSLAPITDLAKWGSDADPDQCLEAWLGQDPEGAAEVCRRLSPDPTRATTTQRLVLHGAEDQVVPIEHSRVYVARAPEGSARLLELAREGHYAFMDPGSDPFAQVLRHLDEWSRQPKWPDMSNNRGRR